ncbi:MAG: hypothetical protein MJ148_04585, partial [Clostridia bacterium]|nr:hypothetical protein [Clostridia bacterium]
MRPSRVQVWDEPCKEADVLLLSTHADDEHIFFGGIIPYYAGELELPVQVAYYTNYWNGANVREHEKLDGLCTVGVKNYPINGDFDDIYATSLACLGGVIQTFDPSAYKLMRFHLNDERSAQKVRQEILASAAIPWGFDPVEIDGVRYVDGAYETAGGDNVPIAPILENHSEIKTIYVIHCNSRQVSPDTDVAWKAKGCKVIEIRPRQTLPGILDDFNLMDSSAFRSWSGVLS